MFMGEKQKGFTIVELLIVIVIIGILFAIVLNSFSDSQARARDTDRKSDIEVIGRRFESVFTNRTLGAATYPRTTDIVAGNAALSGLDPEALRTQRITNSQAMSLIPATNNTATIAGVTPQPTVDQYVYQPLTADNVLCTSGLICVKFNLYYRTEADNVIAKVSSLNQ
jgi:prepilin-type N-terminal cleavage/methylation domain-containing protein